MSQYSSGMFASSNGRMECPSELQRKCKRMARSPRLSWWRWHQQKQSSMVFPNMHITSEERKQVLSQTLVQSIMTTELMKECNHKCWPLRNVERQLRWLIQKVRGFFKGLLLLSKQNISFSKLYQETWEIWLISENLTKVISQILESSKGKVI